MLEPAKSDGLYHEPKDATLDLFKSLYTAVELIADHELARPLGGSIDQARPHLAEAWRSQRSMRNIVINLKAAQDLYTKVFRSEEHTSELQSLMRISYAVFCLKKNKSQQKTT